MNLLKRLRDHFFDAGVKLARFITYRDVCKDFERAASAVQDDGVESWPKFFLSSEGVSEAQHQLAQKIYQQAFVRGMREKRESFLRKGRGVDYINGVLLSLDQYSLRKDVIQDLFFGLTFGDLKGEDAGEALCREMLDFADDALDTDMNMRNPKLASAYLLNLIEAYPQMQEILPQDDVRQAMRDILSRIQDERSNLIDPVLREVLNGHVAKYHDQKPVLTLAPGTNL